GSGARFGGNNDQLTIHGRMHSSVLSRLVRQPAAGDCRPLMLARGMTGGPPALLDVDAVIDTVSKRFRLGGLGGLSSSASLPHLNRLLAARGLPPLLG